MSDEEANGRIDHIMAFFLQMSGVCWVALGGLPMVVSMPPVMAANERGIRNFDLHCGRESFPKGWTI